MTLLISILCFLSTIALCIIDFEIKDIDKRIKTLEKILNELERGNKDEN